MRRRDHGPHREHAGDDPVRHQRDRGLGDVRAEGPVPRQDDVRSQRRDQHDRSVVPHDHDLRRRERPFLEQPRDQIDVDQRIALKKLLRALEVVFRQKPDRPSPLGG